MDQLFKKILDLIQKISIEEINPQTGKKQAVTEMDLIQISELRYLIESMIDQVTVLASGSTLAAEDWAPILIKLMPESVDKKQADILVDKIDKINNIILEHDKNLNRGKSTEGISKEEHERLSNQQNSLGIALQRIKLLTYPLQVKLKSEDQIKAEKKFEEEQEAKIQGLKNEIQALEEKNKNIKTDASKHQGEYDEGKFSRTSHPDPTIYDYLKLNERLKKSEKERKKEKDRDELAERVYRATREQKKASTPPLSNSDPSFLHFIKLASEVKDSDLVPPFDSRKRELQERILKQYFTEDIENKIKLYLTELKTKKIPFNFDQVKDIQKAISVTKRVFEAQQEAQEVQLLDKIEIVQRPGVQRLSMREKEFEAQVSENLTQYVSEKLANEKQELLDSKSKEPFTLADVKKYHAIFHKIHSEDKIEHKSEFVREVIENIFASEKLEEKEKKASSPTAKAKTVTAEDARKLREEHLAKAQKSKMQHAIKKMMPQAFSLSPEDLYKEYMKDYIHKFILTQSPEIIKHDAKKEANKVYIVLPENNDDKNIKFIKMASSGVEEYSTEVGVDIIQQLRSIPKLDSSKAKLISEIQERIGPAATRKVAAIEEKKEAKKTTMEEKYNIIVNNLYGQTKDYRNHYDEKIYKKYGVQKYILKNNDGESVETWVYGANFKKHNIHQPIIEDQILKRAESIQAAARAMGIPDNTLRVLMDRFKSRRDLLFDEKDEKATLNLADQLVKSFVNEIAFEWVEQRKRAGLPADPKQFSEILWDKVEKLKSDELPDFKKMNLLVVNEDKQVRAVQYYERGTVTPDSKDKQYRSAHNRGAEIGISNYVAYANGTLDAKGETINISQSGFRTASWAPIDLYKTEGERVTVDKTFKNAQHLIHNMRSEVETKDEQKQKPTLNLVSVSLLTVVGGKDKQSRQYKESILAAERLRYSPDEKINPIMFDFGVNTVAIKLGSLVVPKEQEFENIRAFLQLQKLFFDKVSDAKIPQFGASKLFSSMKSLSEFNSQFSEIEKEIKVKADIYIKLLNQKNPPASDDKIKEARKALNKVKYDTNLEKTRGIFKAYAEAKKFSEGDVKAAVQDPLLQKAFDDFLVIQDLFLSGKWKTEEQNFQLQAHIAALAVKIEKLNAKYPGDPPEHTAATSNCKSNNDRNTIMAITLDQIRAKEEMGEGFDPISHADAHAARYNPQLDTEGGGSKGELGDPDPVLAKKLSKTSDWATHKISKMTIEPSAFGMDFVISDGSKSLFFEKQADYMHRLNQSSAPDISKAVEFVNPLLKNLMLIGIDSKKEDYHFNDKEKINLISSIQIVNKIINGEKDSKKRFEFQDNLFHAYVRIIQDVKTQQHKVTLLQAAINGITQELKHISADISPPEVLQHYQELERCALLLANIADINIENQLKDLRSKIQEVRIASSPTQVLPESREEKEREKEQYQLYIAFVGKVDSLYDEVKQQIAQGKIPLDEKYKIQYKELLKEWSDNDKNRYKFYGKRNFSEIMKEINLMIETNKLKEKETKSEAISFQPYPLTVYDPENFPKDKDNVRLLNIEMRKYSDLSNEWVRRKGKIDGDSATLTSIRAKINGLNFDDNSLKQAKDDIIRSIDKAEIHIQSLPIISRAAVVESKVARPPSQSAAIPPTSTSTSALHRSASLFTETKETKRGPGVTAGGLTLAQYVASFSNTRLLKGVYKDEQWKKVSNKFPADLKFEQKEIFALQDVQKYLDQFQKIVQYFPVQPSDMKEDRYKQLRNDYTNVVIEHYTKEHSASITNQMKAVFQVILDHYKYAPPTADKIFKSAFGAAEINHSGSVLSSEKHQAHDNEDRSAGFKIDTAVSREGMRSTFEDIDKLFKGPDFSQTSGTTACVTAVQVANENKDGSRDVDIVNGNRGDSRAYYVVVEKKPDGNYQFVKADRVNTDLQEMRKDPVWLDIVAEDILKHDETSSDVFKRSVRVEFKNAGINPNSPEWKTATADEKYAQMKSALELSRYGRGPASHPTLFRVGGALAVTGSFGDLVNKNDSRWKVWKEKRGSEETVTSMQIHLEKNQELRIVTASDAIEMLEEKSNFGLEYIGKVVAEHFDSPQQAANILKDQAKAIMRENKFDDDTTIVISAPGVVAAVFDGHGVGGGGGVASELASKQLEDIYRKHNQLKVQEQKQPQVVPASPVSPTLSVSPPSTPPSSPAISTPSPSPRSFADLHALHRPTDLPPGHDDAKTPPSPIISTSSPSIAIDQARLAGIADPGITKDFSLELKAHLIDLADKVDRKTAAGFDAKTSSLIMTIPIDIDPLLKLLTEQKQSLIDVPSAKLKEKKENKENVDKQFLCYSIICQYIIDKFDSTINKANASVGSGQTPVFSKEYFLNLSRLVETMAAAHKGELPSAFQREFYKTQVCTLQETLRNITTHYPEAKAVPVAASAPPPPVAVASASVPVSHQDQKIPLIQRLNSAMKTYDQAVTTSFKTKGGNPFKSWSETLTKEDNPLKRNEILNQMKDYCFKKVNLKQDESNPVTIHAALEKYGSTIFHLQRDKLAVLMISDILVDFSMITPKPKPGSQSGLRLGRGDSQSS